MRNLKIYQQKRSEYLIRIANKLTPRSKWKDVKEDFAITLTEWNALCGYMNSNDFKENKKFRAKEKKAHVKKLKKLPYSEYLKSDHWLQLKEKIREIYKTCVICNSRRDLHVHHRSYTYRGKPNQEVKDLILLCAECHNLFHTHGKLKK